MKSFRILKELMEAIHSRILGNSCALFLSMRYKIVPRPFIISENSPIKIMSRILNLILVVQIGQILPWAVNHNLSGRSLCDVHLCKAKHVPLLVFVLVKVYLAVILHDVYSVKLTCV